MNSVLTETATPTKPAPRLGNGFWSLVDQGGVSLGNFLSNWILARNLARVDYGIFALLFGVMLLALSVHSSLIAVPLSVYGANATDRERKRLNGYALVFATIIAAPIGLVCLIACIYVKQASLSVWVIVAMFAWLLQETARRALMAELRYRDVLWGDAISYLGQVLGLIIVMREGALGLASAFVVMAVTSAAAGLLQFLQTGVLLPRPQSLIREAKRFCLLGGWPLLGNLTSVLTLQIFPWTLAIARGPAQTAMYQAAGNLLQISHPLLLSIGNVIIPASARAMAKNGIHAAKRTALRYGGQGALLAIPYYLVLVLFPRPALRLLYGTSSPYVKFDYGVRLLVVTYTFVYMTQVLSALFNGVARSKLVFTASLAGAIVAVVVAIPMIALAGITGALIASCFVCGARCLLSVYYYRSAI